MLPNFQISVSGDSGVRLVERGAGGRVGELLTRERGKPKAQGVGEAGYCASGITDEVDAVVEALRPEMLEDGSTVTTLRFDPYGVVGAITPWNFPLLMVFQSVIPALVAGNTVLLKPSEETPLVAMEWVKVFNETLPPNILQLVAGEAEVSYREPVLGKLGLEICLQPSVMLLVPEPAGTTASQASASATTTPLLATALAFGCALALAAALASSASVLAFSAASVLALASATAASSAATFAAASAASTYELNGPSSPYIIDV